MSERSIAFLDSGVGGIPYLLATVAAYPEGRYTYYADNANFPYGERNPADLERTVADAVSHLTRLVEPDVVVVACNTASVVALRSLRANYSIPFVGVVPAIKPAAAVPETRRIGVLATSRTVEDTYVADLITRFASTSEVVLVPASGLVQLVEERFGSFSDEELRLALEEPIRSLLEAQVDAVVLGCTHFIHVRDAVAEMLGPETRVVDSVDGVVRQTLRIAGVGVPAGEQLPRPVAPLGTAVRPRLYRSAPERTGSSYAWLAARWGLELSHAREPDRTHG